MDQAALGGIIGGINYWDAKNEIYGCCFSGKVQGNSAGSIAGGDGGRFQNRIEDCYAEGVVGAGYYEAAGGIAGGGCYVVNTYSLTDCSASHYKQPIGNSTVVNSFWTEETSNIESGNGTKVTLEQMKTQSTFTDAGWNFDTVWKMNPETGYPMLQWEENIKPREEKIIETEITDIRMSSAKVNTSITPTEDGVTYKYFVRKKADSSLVYASSEIEDGVDDSITNLEPETEYIVKIRAYFDNGNNYTDIEKEFTSGSHEIYTINDLETINDNLAGTYKLMRNLDFKDPASYTNGESDERYIYYNQKDENDDYVNSWTPLGTFTGTFDGDYYTINNLYIVRGNGTYVTGLFSRIGETGNFRRTVLNNVKIYAGYYTGGICGGLAEGGLIEECGVTGVISSNSYTGGIAGSRKPEA